MDWRKRYIGEGFIYQITLEDGKVLIGTLRFNETEAVIKTYPVEIKLTVPLKSIIRIQWVLTVG